jgi:hypothetical protein
MRVVAGVVVAGMAILGGGAFYWFVGRDLLNPPDVRQCEWIVKKQLKTPATHQRAALSRGTAVDGAPTISIHSTRRIALALSCGAPRPANI